MARSDRIGVILCVSVCVWRERISASSNTTSNMQPFIFPLLVVCLAPVLYSPTEIPLCPHHRYPEIRTSLFCFHPLSLGRHLLRLSLRGPVLG